MKSAISSIQFRVHSEFDVDFVDADEFYDGFDHKWQTEFQFAYKQKVR